MYVKNTNFAIYLGLAALVGFGASFLFSSSNSESSLLSGDISKASRYNNVKEDPASSVVEEKLQNDADFYNLTENTYELIAARVDNLEDLTSRTIEICTDIPEFKTAIRNVVSLNAKAYNTKQSLATATGGLKKLSEGKRAPEYEQASSNVFVGFQKIEYQLAIGKAFVDEAASYLDGKEGEKCEAIAGLVAEWSIYCMQDAVLNKSDQDIAYWNNKAKEMVSESSAIALAYTPFASGLNLDQVNTGLNLDQVNSGFNLEGLGEELSLEKIASVISLEGVNTGLNLDQVNTGLNLDQVNTGLNFGQVIGTVLMGLDPSETGLNFDKTGADWQ